MDMEQKLARCLDSVRQKIDLKPRVGLVLGSGLGGFADQVKVAHTLPYSEIEGFPVSTAPGHKGRFLFGHVEEVPVVVMQGRVHHYEGYPMQEVVLPVRLMGLLGAHTLLLTNAAGGANFSYQAGDLMLLSDHIVSLVPSPLIGPNLEKLGVRFPDMSEVYDRELRSRLRAEAARLGIPLREGVYLQLSGPQFESPAEVRMARLLGADAIGMSTACEAVAARHMGLRVLGVSCISNLCCGMTNQPLTAEEVEETADRVAPQFTALVKAAVSIMGGGR